MSSPPHCEKCGSTHWKVFRCDGTHVKKPPKVDAPPIQWKGSMEGFRTFGSYSDNFNFNGSTLLRKED